MRTSPFRLALWLALLALGAARADAAPFTLTDDFVGYMKSVLNPFDFGLRDGRFYPYSTRYGRRIGYGRPVGEKRLYVQGETKAEAEANLRAELTALIPRLTAWLAKNHPERPFDALERKAQEMLLDHALTEGIDQLPPAFCTAVLRGDWRALVDDCLYVRAPNGWPDYVKNAAFGRRWIYVSAP